MTREADPDFVPVAERESGYAQRDNVSLDAAQRNGFTMVGFQNDWKTVASR